MKRSLKKPDPSPGEVSSVLRLLSELALNGLLDHGSHPRLVFDTSDFEKLKEEPMPGNILQLRCSSFTEIKWEKMWTFSEKVRKAFTPKKFQDEPNSTPRMTLILQAI